MRIVRQLQKLSFQSFIDIAVAVTSMTEFVHKCWLIAASKFCPNKKNVFENIILSRLRVKLVAFFDSTSLLDLHGRF